MAVLVLDKEIERYIDENIKLVDSINNSMGFFNHRKLEKIKEKILSLGNAEVNIRCGSIEEANEKKQDALNSLKNYLLLIKSQLGYIKKGDTHSGSIDNIEIILKDWFDSAANGIPNYRNIEIKIKGEKDMYLKNAISDLIQNTTTDIQKLIKINDNYFEGNNNDILAEFAQKIKSLNPIISGSSISDSDAAYKNVERLMAKMDELKTEIVGIQDKSDYRMHNVNNLFEEIKEIVKEIGSADKSKPITKKQMQDIADRLNNTEKDELSAAIYVKESIGKNKYYIKSAQDAWLANILKYDTGEDDDTVLYNELCKKRIKIVEEIERLDSLDNVPDFQYDRLADEYEEIEKQIKNVEEKIKNNREITNLIRSSEQDIKSFFSNKVRPIIDLFEKMPSGYVSKKEVISEYHINDINNVCSEYGNLINKSMTTFNNSEESQRISAEKLRIVANMDLLYEQINKVLVDITPKLKSGETEDEKNREKSTEGQVVTGKERANRIRSGFRKTDPNAHKINSGDLPVSQKEESESEIKNTDDILKHIDDDD